MGRGLLLIAVSALAISGCAALEARFARDWPAPAPGLIEPVYAAATVGEVAVFRVSSNGCTTKADLQPVVARRAGAVRLSLRRLKEDGCADPKPQGVELSWTFQELGIRPGARVEFETPYQLPQTAGARPSTH